MQWKRSFTLRMELAINITSSQSSIIITCFNHVAHKKFSKKVIGVIFYIPAEKIMH